MEGSNTPQEEIDSIKKKLIDLENQLGASNPRNLAGIRQKELRTATRANLFGDGSDGDVVVSSDTALTRDMFYNSLTIDTTKTLTPSSYRIFVKEDFIINGTVSANGASGSGATPGTGVAQGSLPGGTSGQTGSTNGGFPNYIPTNGVAGTSMAKCIGGTGGAGGDGGAGNGLGPTATGGAAGAKTGTVYNTPRSASSAYLLLDTQPSVAALTNSTGAGSGAGGESDGAGTQGGAGGGGGASGGMIVIFANRIINNGLITSNGGNGGNGQNAANSSCGGGGGGGGGAGGVIILAYGTKSGVGTVTATGGTGGSAGGGSAFTPVATGGAGGGAGVVYEIAVG